MTVSTEELSWSEWGRTQTLKFYNDRLGEVREIFNTLVSKSHLAITINALLLGLVINALSTKLSETNQIIVQALNFWGSVLLGSYLLSILFSVLLSINIIRPRNFFLSKINDEILRDRFEYKPDTEIAEAAIAQIVWEFESQIRENNTMAMYTTGAWILLGVQPLIILGMFLTLI